MVLPCPLMWVVSSYVHLVTRHFLAGARWLCKPIHRLLHCSYPFMYIYELRI